MTDELRAEFLATDRPVCNRRGQASPGAVAVRYSVLGGRRFVLGGRHFEGVVVVEPDFDPFVLDAPLDFLVVYVARHLAVLAPIPMRLFVNREHLGERLLLVFAHASTLPALRGAVPGYRSSWPG